MSAVLAPPMVDEITALRALVGEASTEADCRALREALAPLLAVVEAGMPPARAGAPRPRPVRALAAAGVHLQRAGGPTSVAWARWLVDRDLAEALSSLGGVL